MARGVGIDPGSRTTRVVELLRSRGGIRWGGSVALPAEADDLGERLRQASIRPSPAVAGLSGKDVLIQYSRVPPAPAWKLRMLVRYQATQGGELDASFHYRLLHLPAHVRSSELTVLTSVAKNDVLEERLESFARQGVRDVDFAPGSLALYEVFSRCPEADETLDQYCLVLDVGATKTEMIIVYNGGLVFARSITQGGADFTRRLASALGIEEERAERLKVLHGEVLDESEIASRPSAERPMLEALHGAADEFFGAVRASLMFARAQTQIVDLKIGRVYLSGAGAALTGLAEFLGDRLNARATAFHPPDEWAVPEEPGKPSPWILALGLARMALESPEDRPALLPPRARKRRVFRRRDVFSYAACVVFAVAFAVATVAHVHNWRVAKRALVRRKQLAEAARRRQAELDAVLASNRLKRTHLRLLGSAAAAGARLAEFLQLVKETLPGPVALSEITFRPGDANKAGARAHVTLAGTVGQSPRERRVVLHEFRDRLKECPWFDPPDPSKPKLIERAPEPVGSEPLEFRLRVPLRIEPVTRPPAGTAQDRKP